MQIKQMPIPHDTREDGYAVKSTASRVIRRRRNTGRNQVRPGLAFAISIVLMLPGLCARADTYTVTSTADDGSPNTLRWAIEQANASPGSTIQIQNNLGTITLTEALPIITTGMTINGGAGNAVSGNNLNRVFFVYTANSTDAVNFQNLTIANGYAKGGDGGFSGGGGMGAGGAIFVNVGAVSVANVALVGNTAQGGKGGDGASNGGGITLVPAAGGGGGLGGNGGNGNGHAGGGGGGFRGNGGTAVGTFGGAGGGGLVGDGASVNGTSGGAGGGPNGGAGGYYYDENGQDGGFGGGGGGAADGGASGGNGGIFGGGGGSSIDNASGGHGGDFGGGGGGPGTDRRGGNGGYGGGGGAGNAYRHYTMSPNPGGYGGFGGGGGGGAISFTKGLGGAYGGNGGGYDTTYRNANVVGSGAGGGGAGLGGAIFVRSDHGASLTFVSGTETASTVLGGEAGISLPAGFNTLLIEATDGQAAAAAIFLPSGTTTFQSGSIQNAIAGDNVSIRKTTSGVLTLSGSNRFTGGTSLEGGVLALGHSDALGDSGTISFVGGTLQFGAVNTNDYSARFSTADNQQFRFDTNGQNVQLSSALSSTDGSLSKLGPGTLTLSGSGGSLTTMVAKGGTLKLDGSGTTNVIIAGESSGDNGSVVFNAPNYTNGYLIVGGSAGSTGNATIAGGTLNSGGMEIGSSGTGSLILDNGSINALNRTIEVGKEAGSVGTLTINGGTATYAGNNFLLIGRYGQGSLTINGGTLTGSTTYIGVSGSAIATVNGGSWDTGKLIVNNADAQSTFIVNGGYVNSTAVHQSFGSAVTVTGGTWNSASYGLGENAPASLSISGGLLTTGTLTSGEGVITLSGNSAGRGVLSASRVVKRGGSSAVVFDGGVLRANTGESDFLSGYGSGDINLQSGGAFIDSNGFSIGITSAFTGPGGLTKIGTGTLTLSGTSNFDGALSPDAGTTIITGHVTSGATSGLATSGSPATLIVSGNGANWTSNADTLIGHNGGTGNLTISDGATASDTFSLVGRTAGSTGTVTVTGPGSTWTHSAGLVIGTGGVGSMLVDAGGHVTNADGTIGGDAGSSGSVRVTGTGSLWMSSSYLVVGNAGSGTLSVDAGGIARVGSGGAGVLTLGNAGLGTGTLNIGAVAGQAAIAAGTVQAASITGGAGSGTKVVNFNHTESSYTFAPVLTGSLRVEHNSGSTNLTGNNSYTGGTVVAGGILSFSSDSNLGALSGAVTMQGGTLRNAGDLTSSRHVVLSANSTFDVGSGYLTFSNPISGPGGLTKTGGNYLTLTGAQTYTGATSIQGGFFKLQSGSLLTPSVDLATGTIFYLADSTGVLTANVTGSGIFNRGGAGTSILTGSVGAGVQTVIESGTLQIGNGGTTGSISGNVLNNGTLRINRSNAVTLNGTISGNGALFQIGSGTTTLTGNNTYLGNTIISAGTLAVQNNTALGTGAVNVNGGVLLIHEGYNVSNTITLTGGSLARQIGSGTNLSSLSAYVGNVSGGQTTLARFLDGETSTAGTLTGGYTLASSALNDSTRVGEVFHLGGVPVVDELTGETDTFVLQLELSPDWLTEHSCLAWLNPATNLWVNAVDGNFGGTVTFVSGAYNPATDFHLGTYGVDIEQGVVWAVLNHNSEFSVVPEPSTWLLLAFGLLTLTVFPRRGPFR